MLQGQLQDAISGQVVEVGRLQAQLQDTKTAVAAAQTDTDAAERRWSTEKQACQQLAAAMDEMVHLVYACTPG
jgi:hypothetical protein